MTKVVRLHETTQEDLRKIKISLGAKSMDATVAHILDVYRDAPQENVKFDTDYWAPDELDEIKKNYKIKEENEKIIISKDVLESLISEGYILEEE